MLTRFPEQFLIRSRLPQGAAKVVAPHIIGGPMRGVVALGVALLVVGACAQQDSGSAAGGTAKAAGGTAAAAPAAPAVVHFTAKDFSFEGPDTIAAGMTTLVLHNDGPSLHNLVLMRLEGGKTFADFQAALAAMKGPGMPPAWAVPSGGVNPPDPGSDTEGTLDIAPGNYAVVCVVDVPDHVPHMMKGMIKPLTVVPSTGPAAPAPTADLTVTEVDFAFDFSAQPTAGHHVIKVVNNGKQAHEFELIRLAPGKTMDDLMHWGQTFDGPLPGSSLGGAAPMVPGQVEYVPVDLTPGDYVALCFLPDPATGKPHLAEGMVYQFKI
jgi:hypothetical protein